MNKRATVVVLLLGLAAGLSSLWVRSASVVHEDVAIVDTWNMEWFPAGQLEPLPARDEARRIREAARAIRANGVPDIFFAEEMRDAQTCTNLLRELRAPDFQVAVCSDFWFDPTNRGLQQVAVFSRYPVVASGFEPWVARDFVFPPRGFAWAVLDTGRGAVLAVVVHLKSNYIPKELDAEKQAFLNRLKREISAEHLVSRIAALQETYGVRGVIVAGDFNTAAEDPRFAEERTMGLFTEAGFRDAFEGIPEKDRPTMPANEWYPAATFDHILARGFERPRTRLVLPATRLSDHRPLRAVFDL